MDDVLQNGREDHTAPLASSPAPVDVRPHDFRRPVESLQQLSDAFADGLSTSLSQHLRATLHVVAGAVEELPYQDFLLALEPATCLGVLRVDPPGAHACVDLPLSVLHPMIDRLLGGNSAAGNARPLAMTEIERSLALQIVERAAAQLAQSWSVATGADVSVREESLESSPAALRIMPPDEVVTVARFELTFHDTDRPDASGTMRLCMPQPVIQQLLDGNAPLLSQWPVPSLGASRAARKQDMTRNVLQAAVELRALLAETKVRLSDVLAMQVGDVVMTETPADANVEMEPTDGGERVTGQLGQLRGSRAVRVTRRPTPSLSSSPSPASHAGPLGGDRA